MAYEKKKYFCFKYLPVSHFGNLLHQLIRTDDMGALHLGERTVGFLGPSFGFAPKVYVREFQHGFRGI